MLTTGAVYRQYWKYVYRVLPAYGIFSHAREDVAQEVWLTVHERLGSYHPEAGTMRGWLTGIVRKCAAAFRRRRRRELVGLAEDLREAAGVHSQGSAELAMGTLRSGGPLGPHERALLFWLIRRALDDDEQYEAFILRHLYGHSIEEIAEIQGASERAVRYRIATAKGRISPEDDDSSAAFLGFGSLETLMGAMEPEDPPSSRGEELWRRISAKIDAGAPPPPRGPGGRPFSKAWFAGLLGGALLLGGELGAAGAVACGPAPAAQVAPEPERAAPMAPRASVSADPAVLAAAPAPAPPGGGSVTTADSSAPAPPTRPAVRSGPAPSPVQSPEAAPHEEPDSISSEILLRQIYAAERYGKCRLVQELVNEHAREFPKQDIQAREAARARCPVKP